MRGAEKMKKSHNNYIAQNIATIAANVPVSLKDEAQESRCLASIVQHGVDSYIDVEGVLSEDTFTFEESQVLWRCLTAFFEVEEVKPTFASIIKYAHDLGYNTFDKKDNKDWVLSLFNVTGIEVQDARILGAELRRLQFKREFYSVLSSCSQDLVNISTKESLTNIAGCVETPIERFLMKMASSGEDGEYLLKNSDVYIENLFHNPNTISGYTTEFNKYDLFVGGSFEPETMHVIMARPKVGKSTFALNVAINLAKKGVHSIIADMEMSERKWINRFLANVTGINLRKFKTAHFTEEEKDLIVDAQKVIKSYPILYMNVNGKSLDEANFCAKRLLNKRVGKNAAGLFDCVYIYDYLRVNDSEDVSDSIREYQALGFQAIKLKNFSKQMKIPTLTFTQESRTGDVSGSDRILWLCDSLTKFSKKTEEEIIEDRAAGRKEFNRKMTPNETRDGEEIEDGVYINYVFDGSIASIKEGPTNAELTKGKKHIQTTEADKSTKF